MSEGAGKGKAAGKVERIGPPSKNQVLEDAKKLLEEWEEEAKATGGKIALRPELAVYDFLSLLNLVDDESLLFVFGRVHNGKD